MLTYQGVRIIEYHRVSWDPLYIDVNCIYYLYIVIHII